MEFTEKYNNKLKDFKKAMATFSKSMELDLFSLNGVLLDVVKNGQIQKFEICSELTWKVSKQLLKEEHGVIANSPNEVFRELFSNGLIDEDECVKLINVIKDRNLLSHVYNEDFMDVIHPRLPEHFKVMQSVLNKIS